MQINQRRRPQLTKLAHLCACTRCAFVLRRGLFAQRKQPLAHTSSTYLCDSFSLYLARTHLPAGTGKMDRVLGGGCGAFPPVREMILDAPPSLTVFRAISPFDALERETVAGLNITLSSCATAVIARRRRFISFLMAGSASGG